MKVFEDLVVELKEENLLEETVIDSSVLKMNGNGANGVHLDSPVPPEALTDFEFKSDEPVFEEPVPAKPLNGSSNGHRRKPKPDTMRRRFADRMQAIQFIEYVLTGVETKISGASGTPFDDLSIKTAFHRFEQACADPDSEQYIAAESVMVDRLDAWEESLKERDSLISVEDLRKYSETANPPLSPQTLFALIRFYRDIEFSEQTRSKFDFITTRLFSKFVDGERRDVLCSRPEIVRHLEQRYSDWSAGRYQKADVDDPDIALFTLTFDGFATEAERAGDLAEMLSTNLFDRVCEFKETAGEMFLAAEVTAAAIECNLRIANKAIDLIGREAELKSPKEVRARYAGIDKEVVSNAVARSFDFGSPSAEELVGDAAPEPKAKPKAVKASTKTYEKPKLKGSDKANKKAPSRLRSSLLGVNKWLLLVTILTVIASAGVYVWSEYYAGEDATTSGVKVVNLEKPELTKYIKVSKISNSMLYAVVTPEYEKLDQNAQRDYLQKVEDAGKQLGYSTVSFMNGQGKTIGYASSQRVSTNGK
jgi:hypothetical protein